MTMAAQIQRGGTWEPLEPANNESNKYIKPVLNEMDGQESIFVSLTTFMDEERCAKTLQSIFDNAKNPNRVYVGLVEHNVEPIDAKTQTCLAQYCRLNKIMDEVNFEKKCPHYKQIRHLRVFTLGASGPVRSRALQRKNLGDEEFCLQIDNSSTLVHNWDELAIDEWKKVGNEFGVLSSEPSKVEDMTTDIVNHACHTSNNQDTLIPEYGDKLKIKNLEMPLIGHGWSAAMSFSKCHLEENVPYDYFLPMIVGAEEFSRYLRMFTRGYDVYTPSMNLVYKDYSPKKLVEGTPGTWPQKPLLRINSQKRLRTLVKSEPGMTTTDYANLNLYGLGKRRSLEQLKQFSGVDILEHNIESIDCGKQSWIPYDTAVAPTDNLYTDTNDEMDPFPIFPMRSKANKYGKSSVSGSLYTLKPKGVAHPQIHARLEKIEEMVLEHIPVNTIEEVSNNTSASTIFMLWMTGIIVWCFVYLKLNKINAGVSGGGGVTGGLLRRRKKFHDAKRN